MSCGKVHNNSYFTAQDCIKVVPWFAAVFQITWNNRSVNPIAENFPFFLQLFEVIWGATANLGETLIQSCAENYEGSFCILPHEI